MSLESWRDGSARTTIIDFVAAVTGGADAVSIEERVAVFDNDGCICQR